MYILVRLKSGKSLKNPRCQKMKLRKIACSFVCSTFMPWNCIFEKTACVAFQAYSFMPWAHQQKTLHAICPSVSFWYLGKSRIFLWFHWFWPYQNNLKRPKNEICQKHQTTLQVDAQNSKDLKILKFKKWFFPMEQSLCSNAFYFKRYSYLVSEDFLPATVPWKGF